MNYIKQIRMISFTVAAIVLISGYAQARIKLVALPEREATIIRLDNPQFTLIEEERVLTLQSGANKVDFSWNGVSIDPDSIRLEILSHPNEVVLLNVSYPPNENALVWEISSKGAWEETVRVSYLLSNIDRLITYKAIANKAETEVDLKSHLILRNFSGEDFDTARVLLDYGEAFEKGIQHEETKQLLFFNKNRVPVTKVWKWDSQKQIWDPEKVDTNVGIPVTYKIANDIKSALGKNALWGGKVRVYQNDGNEGTILLGEDRSNLTPIGEEMEVYIGDSRDIVVTQRKMKDKKVNLRRNSNNNVILYDNEETITAKIENFKDSKAVLTMVQHFSGEWKMKKCNMKYERIDADTIEFNLELPANSKQELEMNYVRLNIR